MWLDALLVSKGFPPTSEWWKRTLKAFFEGKKMRLVLRVGRRGGKSSTLCRAAIVVALYGGHNIPPGDTGIIGIVSVSKPEARKRLRTMRAILDALGMKHAPTEDGGLSIVGTPFVAQCFAATLGAVVGGTWVVAFFDEVARWKDADTGVNPATQVLASARPTLATQPNAREFMSSSPMGEYDAHFDAFEEGANDNQDVAHAPTWEANPTLTEEATRKLERDEATHAREYGAVPQATMEEGLLTAGELDEVTRKAPPSIPPEPGHVYFAAMDPANRRDAWTLVIMTRNDAGKKVVVFAKEWHGTPSARLSPTKTLEAIADICLGDKRDDGSRTGGYRVREVYTDQKAADELREIGETMGLTLIEEAWTQPMKLVAFDGLRVRIRDKEVEVSNDNELRADLLAVRKRITRNGITIEFPRIRGRHCDYAGPVAVLAGKHMPLPTKDHQVADEDRMREERRKRVLAAQADEQKGRFRRAGSR